VARFDISAVGKAVLNAAANAAGKTWKKVQHDFTADLQQVLQNASNIALQLESGQLSEAEAQDLLKDQSAILFLLAEEVDVDSQIVVQNAVNAAVDALWSAVKAAAGLAA